MMAADDPVTCAIYGKQHNLLKLPGWKLFKHLAHHNDEFKQLLFNVKTNYIAK
jgi:predicted SprT family Zn-dependent metalloprotease